MAVVLTTLAATLLIQLGYFLWKLSAEGQPRIGAAPARQVMRALLGDPRWLAGTAANGLGWVLFVQATALGDISLVQPLMSAGDLLLVVLAVVFLHERLVRTEWLGVAVTVLGAALLTLDAEDLPLAAFDGARLALLLGAAAAVGGLLAWAGRGARAPEIGLALLVGLCFGAGSVLTKALTASAAVPGQRMIGWAIVLNPLLVAVIAANVAGLVLLQAAFQRGRAAIIVTVQLAVANALTVLAGLLVFGEHITPLRVAGIALIVAGAALLHLKPAAAA